MGLGIYIVIISVLILFQLFDLIQNREFTRTLLIYYPFGDQSSQPCCLNAIMFFYSLLITVFAVAVLIPIDSLLFLIFLNIPMTSAIIQEHLLELNNVLEIAIMTEDVINKRLLEYLVMHKKHNE